MPKPFTSIQKKEINQKLIEIGLIYMNQYPIKDIMLDWVVHDVGISKGAFYLFYDSKESLFYDCLMKIHENMHISLYKAIQDSDKSDKKQALLDVLLTMLQEISKAPWLIKLSDENYTTLIKKIGQEKMEEHFKDDEDMGEKILTVLGLSVKNVDLVTASLRGIFLLFLHEKEIGNHIIFDVVKMQIKATVDYIFKEEIV